MESLKARLPTQQNRRAIQRTGLMDLKRLLQWHGGYLRIREMRLVVTASVERRWRPQRLWNRSVGQSKRGMRIYIYIFFFFFGGGLKLTSYLVVDGALAQGRNVERLDLGRAIAVDDLLQHTQKKPF